MEANLLRIARDEFQLDETSALVFCSVAPREEHLQRLACANVFLDTPAYNAHTVGCDALFAGVPMISLLRPHTHSSTDDEETDDDKTFVDPLFVDTEKLASRVGASLLQAVGLEEMVCPTMRDYAALMVKCAVDKKWYASIRARLKESRMTCPLFDTKRWVENLELAFRHIVLVDETSCEAAAAAADIVVVAK
jgi:protein O-GlcNAc transferase